MKRVFPTFVSLLLVAIAGCDRPVPKVATADPVKVKVAVPTKEMVTQFEEFTGRTSAVRTVEVRSRVTGFLNNVLFKDGAEVQEGEELFAIDDRSFKSTAAAATALVAQAQTRVERLSGQYRRGKQLVATKSITQEQFEQLEFDQAEAVSMLAAAKAAKELADLNVEYTRVLAPISGTISNRKVDPGNVIKADDISMATIVKLNPIYAYFDINERTVLRLRRMMDEGKIESADKAKLKVGVALADEDAPSHEGTIDFVDSQVDASTGTQRVRATIVNNSKLLSPGLFVRLRFPVGEPHLATLIPEEALVSDQGQRFVYVVGQDNKTAYRRVKIGMLVNGRRVIEEGVKPAERVVVQGLQRVKEGTTVIAEPFVPESPGITAVSSPAAVPPKAAPPVETSPSAFPPQGVPEEAVKESKEPKKSGQ
jgi:multidrug efflux system membrane fusion protein